MPIVEFADVELFDFASFSELSKNSTLNIAPKATAKASSNFSLFFFKYSIRSFLSFIHSLSGVKQPIN